MKKIMLLITLLPLLADAQPLVSLDASGQLRERMEQAGLGQTRELAIAGPLNGTDIYFLRTLLGDPDKGISVLDLSQTRIVAGGEAYAVNDSYSDNVEHPYYTEDDILGDQMFLDCQSLRHITLPQGIKLIGDICFANSLNLEEVVVPEHVKRIQSGAFMGCQKLKHVTLPASLLSLDDHVFEDCESLLSVEVYDNVPPAYGYECFPSPEKLCLIVRTHSVNEPKTTDYQKADGWRNFGQIIKGTEGSADAIENVETLSRDGREVRYTLGGIPITDKRLGITIHDGKIVLSR